MSMYGLLIRCGLLGAFLLGAGLCQAESSVFTKIDKQQWLMESKHAFVVRDKYPQAPLHLLIITKHPYRTLMDVEPEVLADMFAMIQKVAERFGIAESGFRTVINTNTQGGQSVYHFHIHLLAGRQLSWPPG